MARRQDRSGPHLERLEDLEHLVVGRDVVLLRAHLLEAHHAFGVDDEQYGQRLVAFVVLTPTASATKDVLKQHVRANLANYKVPREIIVLDELPRSSTGKISRRDLHGHIGRSSP